MHRPLVKKSTQRPPTPVQLSSHAFASKPASPVACLHPPYLVKNFFDSSGAIVRFANAACKPCDAPCAHRVPKFRLMNEAFTMAVAHVAPNLGAHVRNGPLIKGAA